MMCQRMGRLPIGAIGFGMTSLTSRKRVPRPPHKIATFIVCDGESKSSLLLIQCGTVKLEVCGEHSNRHHLQSNIRGAAGFHLRNLAEETATNPRAIQN